MPTATKQQKSVTADDREFATARDEELMVRYRDTGDRDAFAQLVSRHERCLYNYLCRYVRCAELAEDVFQATFLQVHLKADLFEPQRSFRAWLYAIATNQAIDAMRRNKRHRAMSLERLGESDKPYADGKRLADALLSDEPSPECVAGDEETGQLLREAVGELSDPMRATLELVYYEGMKYREAAEVLKVPVGTIKSRLNMAVAKLTDIWKRCRGQTA